MKKMLVLSVFMCILTVIISLSINAAISGQAIELMSKVGGLDIDDGSGEDALVQGVPVTQFDGFNAYINLDIQESKIYNTLVKRDETISTALLDVDADGDNEIAVTLDGLTNTAVVSVDSNDNGVIGDPGDDILEPLAGTQEVANLILPGGDIMSTAAGTDEYNGNLYTQFSFDPIGLGTVIVTDDNTGLFVTFEMPPREDSCTDGLDTDGDSFVDCEDFDCIYAPTCDNGKNKIGYTFKRLRAEAEEVSGNLAGEVVFELAITPRHHEAAFTAGPVHWTVAPMIDDFTLSAAPVVVTSSGNGTQVMILPKADDWFDDPGAGATITWEHDDGAIMRAIIDAYGRGCEDPVIEINNVGTLEITQTVGANTYTDVIPADRVRISGFLTSRDDSGPIDLQGHPVFTVKDAKIMSFVPSTTLVSAASSEVRVKINSEIEFTGVLSDIVKEQYNFVSAQVTGTVDITGGPIPGKPGMDFEISGPTFIKRIN